MQPNRLVYGAWGLLLVGAAVIAIANSQAEPEGEVATSQRKPSAELKGTSSDVSTRPPLSATPASFAQEDAPRRLPVVSDTDPLAETKLKELRRIIAEEMPGASDVQLDVWTEEFADMPEDAIRLMLQQRRELMGLPAPAKTPVGPIDHTQQQHGAIEIDADVASTIRAVATRNLANVNTTGYRRRVVEFSGGGSTSALNIAELRFDMTSAPARYTGRSTDIATDTGFFAVQDGKEFLFTRAGRFSIGKDRYLALLVGNRQLRLAGVEPVPENCEALKISVAGVVMATTAAAESELGKVRLVNFIDASRLSSEDGCVFQGTAASGPPHDLAAPQIRQEWLEPSNVDPALERQSLGLLSK